MDCFGTFFTHVSKLVKTFLFKLLCHGLLRYIFAHAQTCEKFPVQSANQWIPSAHTCACQPVITFLFEGGCTQWTGTFFTHVQTLFQSTTQWTASVHTLHIPKPVIQQRSCSKCYAMDDATLSWCLWHLHTWSMLPDMLTSWKNGKSTIFFLVHRKIDSLATAKSQFGSWSHGPAT